MSSNVADTTGTADTEPLSTRPTSTPGAPPTTPAGTPPTTPAGTPPAIPGGNAPSTEADTTERTAATRSRRGDEPRAGRTELLDVTLRWSDLGLFVACYAAMVAVWVAVGEFITHSSSIEARDQSVAEWFVDSRTATLDTLSALGSNLAATMVKIAVTAVLAIVMRLVWKRWREPLMMVVPLVLEASVFITVTYIVSRPRPDVERLESSPVDSSYPSGHVAAAAAYGALIIIVWWHVRNRIARACIVALSIALPVIVGWARMYRGMHHLTDVLAGVVLGIVSVALSWWMIHRAIERTRSTQASESTQAIG